MTNPYIYILVVAILVGLLGYETKGTDLAHRLARWSMFLVAANGFYLVVRHFI